MNAGFSSLAWLKRRLLLASDVAGTTYDEAVTAVGLGVASQIEAFCDRKFERTAGEIHEAHGNRTYFVVPRYPIEAVSAVESRESSVAAWTTVDASNWNFIAEAGLVTMLFPPTGPMGSVRVTYTGGYWWDTTEDATGSKPSAATALPDALRQAWVTACKTFWDRSSLENSAKAGFGGEEAGRMIAMDFDLPAVVQKTLAQFRRFA